MAVAESVEAEAEAVGMGQIHFVPFVWDTGTEISLGESVHSGGQTLD